MCPFCLDTALDPLGHHAVTCRHGRDVVIRHNHLRDEVLDLCHCAHLSVSVERGHGLTRDLAHTRPLLLAGTGKPAVLDLITLPLCSAILSELAGAAEACKFHSNGPKCQEFLHSVSCGDIWQLGQRGPQHLFQAGILPGHSPVLPQITSCGRNLWPVEYGPGSFHCQSHPGQGAPALLTAISLCLRE